MSKCERCATENAPDSIFCFSCGNRIGSGVVTEAQVVTEPSPQVPIPTCIVGSLGLVAYGMSSLSWNSSVHWYRAGWNWGGFSFVMFAVAIAMAMPVILKKGGVFSAILLLFASAMNAFADFWPSIKWSDGAARWQKVLDLNSLLLAIGFFMYALASAVILISSRKKAA